MSTMTRVEAMFTNNYNLDTEPAYSIIKIIGKDRLLENPLLRYGILERLADIIANNLGLRPCELDIEKTHFTNMKILPEYIGIRGNLYPYSILTKEIRFTIGINFLILRCDLHNYNEFVKKLDSTWQYEFNKYNAMAEKCISTKEFLNDIIGISKKQLRIEIEKVFFNYV